MTRDLLENIVTRIRNFQERVNTKDELQLHRAAVLKDLGPIFFEDVSQAIKDGLQQINQSLKSSAISVDKSPPLHFNFGHYLTCSLRLEINRRRIVLYKQMIGDDPTSKRVETAKVFALSVARDDSICTTDTDTHQNFNDAESMGEYIIAVAFEGLSPESTGNFSS